MMLTHCLWPSLASSSILNQILIVYLSEKLPLQHP